MSMGTIYVGDVGTPIVLSIVDAYGAPVDVSSATAKDLILLAPGAALGTGVVRPAALVTDGIDGQISYSTVDGDIDIAGTWRVQARVTLAGGAVFRSSIDTFVAHEVL